MPRTISTWRRWKWERGSVLHASGLRRVYQGSLVYNEGGLPGFCLAYWGVFGFYIAFRFRGHARSIAAFGSFRPPSATVKLGYH